MLKVDWRMYTASDMFTNIPINSSKCPLIQTISVKNKNGKDRRRDHSNYGHGMKFEFVYNSIKL